MNASLSSAQNFDQDVDNESALPMFWISLFAAIAIVGLLFAFQQVVHAAVEQADSKRISASADAHSAWLCKSATTPAERQACVAQPIVQQSAGSDTANIMHTAYEPAVSVRP